VSKTILITNICLSNRSGTEVVVEQLADGLRRRGHLPLLFSPQLGPLADGLRARGHLVADTPAGFPFRPDLIHAHHTGPAMAAIAAHPGVPALFVCHDAGSAFDARPTHPRLHRVFAVDERCRARLVADGLDASAVELLPNAVDLSRIPARAALPERPRTAVAFTKQSAHLDVLRRACATANITLSEFGFGTGRMVDQPEQIFAEADLVFATARTALEASAAGAGVIVCDARGCAGFLTRANAEAWLPYNLGAGILARPCGLTEVSASIADWSTSEAVAASTLIRERSGLDRSLDRLEAIYTDMLAKPSIQDEALEAAAVGAFIAGWVPHFDQNAPWRRLADHVAQPSMGSIGEAQNQSLAALAAGVDALATAQSETRELLSATDHAAALRSLDQALQRQLTTLGEGIDALAAIQSQTLGLLISTDGAADRPSHHLDAPPKSGLSTVAEKVDALAATHAEAVSVLIRKMDVVEGHLSANNRVSRIEAILRGLWRRTVPHAIRAPLYRVRRRMLSALVR